jgi:hypothetical protein
MRPGRLSGLAQVSQAGSEGTEPGYYLDPNTGNEEKCWAGYYCPGYGKPMKMCEAGTYNYEEG